jgi:MinD-like ATPase involved in chromosome partitioning or flagellar assembly
MNFSDEELIQLPYQLTLFIGDMRRDERFKNLENIVQLSVMLVDTNKGMTYNLVYKLLKLVLTLPVATASVERLFSSMTFVKNKLRNKMGNQLVNDFWLHLMRRSSSYK